MDLIAWQLLVFLVMGCAGFLIGLHFGRKERDAFLEAATSELSQMLTETKQTLELIHEHGNRDGSDGHGGIDYAPAAQPGAPVIIVNGKPPGAH